MRVRVKREAVDAIAIYRAMQGKAPDWDVPEDGEYLVLDLPRAVLDAIAAEGYDYDSPEDLTQFFLWGVGYAEGGDA